MNDMTRDRSPRLAYELAFRSLFSQGRGFSFPCDALGRVNLEALSARARQSYLQAQACVGRELAAPAVVPRIAD